MVRFILLLALAVALAGCTHTLTTDAETFSVKGPTAKLPSGTSVALVNGYASEATTEIGKHGDTFVVDLRQVTDTAIVMASRHLQAMGVVISAGAQKKVTMKVTNGETRFQYIPFASRFRTSLSLSSAFADGTDALVAAEASTVVAMGNAPEVVKRGVEAAAATAVTNLMNDPGFVSYLSK